MKAAVDTSGITGTLNQIHGQIHVSVKPELSQTQIALNSLAAGKAVKIPVSAYTARDQRHQPDPRQPVTIPVSANTAAAQAAINAVRGRR